MHIKKISLNPCIVPGISRVCRERLWGEGNKFTCTFMHLQLRRPSEACNTRVLGQVSTEAKTSGEWVFKWCFTHVLSLTSNYYGKFCICLIDFFKSPVLLIFSFWMNFLKLTIFLHIWSNLPNFSFLLSFFPLDTYMLFHCQLLL